MLMLIWGDFEFSVGEDTTYSGLTRTSTGGFKPLSIFGSKPLLFNTGQTLENIKISGGWFYKEGLQKLADLRALQGTLEPQLMTDSYGNNLGLWVMKLLTENQENIIDDGTPLYIKYSIEWEEYINAST